MDIEQIKSIGKELNTFLSKFDDCFSQRYVMLDQKR
jgi:hypothetical protein